VPHDRSAIRYPEYDNPGSSRDGVCHSHGGYTLRTDYSCNCAPGYEEAYGEEEYGTAGILVCRETDECEACEDNYSGDLSCPCPAHHGCINTRPILNVPIGTKSSGYICYEPCATASGYGTPGFPDTASWHSPGFSLSGGVDYDKLSVDPSAVLNGTVATAPSYPLDNTYEFNYPGV